MTGQEGRSGGSRPGSGRKPGPPREPSAWPEGHNLKTRDACVAFIEDYVEELWTQNVLDARLGGCINGAVRLLGDIQGWITKAPLQIIQAQTVIKADTQKLAEVLQEDERVVFARAIRRLEESQDQSGNH